MTTDQANPMRIGIIGASFARAAYLPALRHVPGVEVAAIASHRLDSAKAAAQEFGIAAAYDDWQAMLKNHPLDIVLIASPTDLHAPMAMAALEKGAHVLCEKPMAMTAAEARLMLDHGRASGRLHMIDHELRFNPNRMRIAELIADGTLGEIHHVNIASIGSGWADPASRVAGDWWSLEERGGGRLGANGSHQVDLLRWWLGPVASVVGEALTIVPDRLDKTTRAAWTATADDLVYCSLVMKSGARAQVFISAVARANIGNLTQVFGSKGTIVLNNDNERLLFATAGEAFQDITVTDPNAALSGLNPGIWNVSAVAALRELVDAARNGRPLQRGATFADGLSTQLVLDAVKQSGVERRWIDLDAEADGHAAA